MIVDIFGFFVVKRKFVFDNFFEKIIFICIVNGSIYFIMEIVFLDSFNDINVFFGKVIVGVFVIIIDWIKEIFSIIYLFLNFFLVVDEFDEFYVIVILCFKFDDVIRDGFWVGKFDDDGDILWN